MNVVSALLPGVLLVQPRVFSDHRGHFFESWNARAFVQATGLAVTFVQDNHAYSLRNVLRGIHYQVVRPQGKLVRVVSGTVLDVVVDLRRSSPEFGHWASVELSAENRSQLWIPAGFGHGYLVRSEAAIVLYKTTEYWFGEHDRTLRWDDRELAIDWALDGSPIVAARDADAPALRDAEVFP